LILGTCLNENYGLNMGLKYIYWETHQTIWTKFQYIKLLRD